MVLKGGNWIRFFSLGLAAVLAGTSTGFCGPYDDVEKAACKVELTFHRERADRDRSNDYDFPHSFNERAYIMNQRWGIVSVLKCRLIVRDKYGKALVEEPIFDDFFFDDDKSKAISKDDDRKRFRTLMRLVTTFLNCRKSLAVWEEGFGFVYGDYDYEEIGRVSYEAERSIFETFNLSEGQGPYVREPHGEFLNRPGEAEIRTTLERAEKDFEKAWENAEKALEELENASKMAKEALEELENAKEIREKAEAALKIFQYDARRC